MKPYVQKLIDEFNSGDFDDILSYFGDIQTLMQFLKKENALYLIDPFNSNLEDYQLELLNTLINELNSKEALQKCVDEFSDVVQKEDGYYLKLDDRSDLCKLFDDSGRDTTARSVAESVFEEDMWEPYNNTTDDVYRDVIGELNPTNIEHLKTYILDRLTNWGVEVDDDSPDLFQNYADNEGMFYLTSENVGDIIGDEESMKYLMDEDYLEHLESELYSIHNNAYNSAYETEIYDMVMSELETFFDVKSAQWVSEPNKNSNDESLTEFYYIKFNPNEIANSIGKYVKNRNNWGIYQWNIDYMGSWMDLMYQLMDDGDENWLDFRIPDYADSRLVDRYINEMFGDYI